jgi:hypothetical protein
MDDWITTHFRLSEFTRSEYAIRHGIDNNAPSDVLARLLVLADGIERVRGILGVPIHIQSGYRSGLINAAIGGQRNSQHCLGEAVDFIASDYGSPLDVCQAILDHEELIDFDQLINEGAWTHISFTTRSRPRGQVLTAHFAGGHVSYSEGLR